MLPTNPTADDVQSLGPHTVTLLRRLAALPALVERYGWHRPLALPSMVQVRGAPPRTLRAPMPACLVARTDIAHLALRRAARGTGSWATIRVAQARATGHISIGGLTR